MKILHIDIETAPEKAYVWGFFKQNIAENQIVEHGYTLSFAARWEGEKKVHFYSINKDGFDNMIEQAWLLLDEADAVVHYNGEKFDIPTLNREFLINDYAPPTPYHQIDLYKVVKRRFNFPRNGMDYVCKRLGITGKVPHKGMDLWTECMSGDKKAWETMEKYNKQDVVMLGELYVKLLPWIQNHPNHALFVDTNEPVCPNCGSTHVVKNGVEPETTNTQAYQRYRCQECSAPLRGRFTIVPKEKKHGILVQSKL